MPMRARVWVGAFVRSMPSKSTAPAGRKRPMTVFISVVLPAPLRPIRPIIAPSGTSSETSRRMRIAPIDTLTLPTLSTRAHHVTLDLRVGERRLGRGVGDDAAVVEGEHALREAAHHLHVVLDEEHR